MIAIDRPVTLALFRRGVPRRPRRQDGLYHAAEPGLPMARPGQARRAILVEGDRPQHEWRPVEVEG